MKKRSPRLMVIGLDAVSMTLLDAYASCCPAIHKMIRRGAAGRAVPCLPVWTPTNWAALSTGAGPSVTLAPGWQRLVNGEQLSTFDRRAIACDTIFESAARAGLTSLAISYPTAYPIASRKQMVLVPLDRGLVSNGLIPGKILTVQLDDQGRFSFPLVEAPKSMSGPALAKAVGATEDGADLAGPARHVRTNILEAHAFKAARGPWRLGFSPERSQATIDLPLEAWSQPIRVDVAAPGRPGHCTVRVMVFDGGKRLAVSEAYDIGQLGSPQSLAREVLAHLGPPIEHGTFFAQMKRDFTAGLVDRKVFDLAHAELAMQADWIVNAAKLAQRIEPFDVFYLHHHYPDSVLHTYLNASEGSSSFKPAQQRLARDIIRKCLRICDKLVADLVAGLAGPETTVMLCSDHGTASNRYGCNCFKRLEETGLLVRKADGAIDRRKSIVWQTPDPMAPMTWLSVNAREGTPRYRRLQARVIDALLDWKTPDGERVVAVALAKKDGHLLGYSGRCCGDVVFHYNSGFAWYGQELLRKDGVEANHGPQMPATFGRTSDNLAFYAMFGPRIKKGCLRDEAADGYVRIEDLVPTACRAADVPVPLGATGCVRQDLLSR